jgi:hypothetical protein
MPLRCRCRIYRVSGFVYSRPNWVPPNTKGLLILPHLGPRGESHWLAGEGVGGPNSDEGTSLWYFMYIIIPLRTYPIPYQLTKR